MNGHMKRLLADRRGATLVEFAILAPVFIMMLLCIMEIAILMFSQSTMQTAVEAVGRRIAIGGPQRDKLSAALFKIEVCKTLPPNMSCDKLSIDVSNAPTLDLLMARTDPTISTDGYMRYEPGGPNTYNKVRLGYIWNVVSVAPNFNLGNMGPGKKLMQTTTIIKVEPYNL